MRFGTTKTFVLEYRSTLRIMFNMLKRFLISYLCQQVGVAEWFGPQPCVACRPVSSRLVGTRARSGLLRIAVMAHPSSCSRACTGACNNVAMHASCHASCSRACGCTLKPVPVVSYSHACSCACSYTLWWIALYGLILYLLLE